MKKTLKEHIDHIKKKEVEILKIADGQELPTIIPAMMGAILTILEHPSIDEHSLKLAIVNLSMIITKISMPSDMKDNTENDSSFPTIYH